MIHRYDIYNNLPHGALSFIAKRSGCSTTNVIRVLKGNQSDLYGIIEKAELIASINLWQQRFCKKTSELEWKDVLSKLYSIIECDKNDSPIEKNNKMSVSLYDKLLSGERIINDVLQSNVDPPIKGDITRNKLRWRGIKIVQQKDNLIGSWRWWVEQRGKRISNIYHE